MCRPPSPSLSDSVEAWTFFGQPRLGAPSDRGTFTAAPGTLPLSSCVCARVCASVRVFRTRLGAPSGRGTYTAAPGTLPLSSCVRVRVCARACVHVCVCVCACFTRAWGRLQAEALTPLPLARCLHHPAFVCVHRTDLGSVCSPKRIS